MSLFKELYQGTSELIKGIKLPFIEKGVKRAIESARDNALQKINENELKKLECLKEAVDGNTFDPESIGKLVNMVIDAEDQKRIVKACEDLYADLFDGKMSE